MYQVLQLNQILNALAWKMAMGITKMQKISNRVNMAHI